MAEIHKIKKRMPVILHPEDEQKCLQQALLHQFAFPCVVNLIATKTPDIFKGVNTDEAEYNKAIAKNCK